MRSKAVLAVVAMAAAGALLVAGPAGAGGGAETTVTIKATGGQVYGKVKSPKPQRCAAGRKVTLYQVKGGSPGGGDDVKRGSDTADANNGGYEYDMGNPGVQGKKVYTKVNKIQGCKGDRSKVVRAT